MTDWTSKPSDPLTDLRQFADAVPKPAPSTALISRSFYERCIQWLGDDAPDVTPEYLGDFVRLFESDALAIYWAGVAKSHPTGTRDGALFEGHIGTMTEEE